LPIGGDGFMVPPREQGRPKRRAGHEMNPYRYKISLRVRHPTIDSAEITRIFGHVPSHSWQAGVARVTPRGRPLGGTREQSYWTAPLAEGEWPGNSLAAAIGEVLDSLTSRREDLARLRVEGATIELFVGWFCDGNTGDVLDCALMARMAELNLDLSLDFYP